MTFTEVLKTEISHRHLLSHPFYQAWMDGRLTREQLGRYAYQYSPHVNAFPRFVSAVHARAEDPNARKMLMENLVDEEGSKDHASHPELWNDFAAALGTQTLSVQDSDVDPAARHMVETFHRLCRSSYEEGLGALYAYEYQVPAIARTKTDGLKKFYGIEKGPATAFFDVHESADVYHAEACEHLLNALTDDQKKRALKAASEAAQSLWDFLSEVYAEKSAA